MIPILDFVVYTKKMNLYLLKSSILYRVNIAGADPARVHEVHVHPPPLVPEYMLKARRTLNV